MKECEDGIRSREIITTLIDGKNHELKDKNGIPLNMGWFQCKRMNVLELPRKSIREEIVHVLKLLHYADIKFPFDLVKNRSLEIYSMAEKIPDLIFGPKPITISAAITLLAINENSELSVAELCTATYWKDIGGKQKEIAVVPVSKQTVKKLIEEKATWSSFSGSLAKTENNLIKSPSIRGPRYFGPSKMSFLNLIKHSMAIIAVFKTGVIFRSIAFYAIYLIIIAEYISIITAIPLALIIIFGLVILKISGRENMTEFNNSVSNIEDIENLK